MDHQLKDVLTPITIIGSLGASLILFVKTYTDYVLKRKMIEKGYVNDDTQAIFKQHNGDNRYGSLKWGLIILFAGLSLIIMEYVPAAPDSPMPYGLFAVSVSIGFLLYYYLVKRDSTK